MAGYFVKMDIDLAESEPVVLISEITGESPALTIGKLYLFWRWVERHCGASRGVTKMSRLVTLATVTGCDTAFLEALESVGWLVTCDGRYCVPNWDKRFSHTAQRKDSSAERTRRYRENKRSGKCVTKCDGVTRHRDENLSRSNVTQASPEVEVETELELEVIPPKVPQGGRSASDYHPDFLAWFQAYPKHERKKEAFRAWKVAGKGIVTLTGCSRADAVKVLLSAAIEFAASDLGKSGQYCPNPAAWLRQGRWDDDRALWERRAESSAKPSRGVAQL